MKKLFEGPNASASVQHQQRMEPYLVPHTKSAANPNMYKYHDYVRTRQQL